MTANIPEGPNNPKKQRFETLQLHVGQENPDPVTGARATPIYMTTSYVFDNCDDGAAQFALQKPGYIYGRLANPTQEVFENRIAALESGTAALATASGAAAILYTIMNLAQDGGHIVSSNAIYGGTYNTLKQTLPHYGIETTFVKYNDYDAYEKAIQDNTRALYIETFGNPNAYALDYERIAKIAHDHGIPLVVDNTFATPYIFRPLEHGADIVVESATKFIGGHGTTLGGVIIENGKFDWAGSGKFPHMVDPDPSYHGVSFAKDFAGASFVTRIRALLLRDTGACISPFNAFMLLQGLETMSLRVERQWENARAVVEYLSKNPKVRKVNHPYVESDPTHDVYQKYFPNGGGSIFTFEVNGTREQTKKFVDSLKLFSNLANVADMKSLVCHPAGTTHSQMSEEELAASDITGSTVRLSIGCEHIDDIIADLDQALGQI